VGIINPDRNGDAFILNKSTGMYNPSQPDEEFMLPAGWGPRFQSGATLLPNGQFLVSHSLRGKLGQIGNDSVIDWEYNVPLNPGGETASRTQRILPPVFFKAEWLETNDLRLQNLPLDRQGVIELYDDLCPDGGDDVLWDWNGDGCLEDDDQDGVTNDADWCPNSEQDETVDELGCFDEPEEVLGCTDEAALNYNPEAEVDDDSCEYPPPSVVGCMDETASNYNPSATENDQTMCEYPPPEVEGCMDETAENYNPDAPLDDSSCIYPPPPPTEGCHDVNATNHNPSTDVHNASMCTYPEPPVEPEPVLGCTNASATNHLPEATQDDGSCEFPRAEGTGDEDEGNDPEPPIVTCEERGDCPSTDANQNSETTASTQVPLVIGLSVVAVVLLAVVVSLASRRLYRDDE